MSAVSKELLQKMLNMFKEMGGDNELAYCQDNRYTITISRVSANDDTDRHPPESSVFIRIAHLCDTYLNDYTYKVPKSRLRNDLISASVDTSNTFLVECFMDEYFNITYIDFNCAKTDNYFNWEYRGTEEKSYLPVSEKISFIAEHGFWPFSEFHPVGDEPFMANEDKVRLVEILDKIIEEQKPYKIKGADKLIVDSLLGEPGEIFMRGRDCFTLSEDKKTIVQVAISRF